MQVKFSYFLTFATTDFFLFLSGWQDRDTQKLQWIHKFVEELDDDKWVIPALKQIREIISLFPEVW